MFFDQDQYDDHYFYITTSCGRVLKGVCHSDFHFLLLLYAFYGIIREEFIGDLVYREVQTRDVEPGEALSVVIPRFDTTHEHLIPRDCAKFFDSEGIRWALAREKLREADWKKQPLGHA
jgi:hypothetical protein